MLKKLKEQVGLFVVIIGAVATFLWKTANFEDRSELQYQSIKKDFETVQVQAEASDELFEAKLEPIKDLGEELKTELRIVKANQAGLEIAATDGADRRARLLEGRLLAFENQVVMTQEAMADSISKISYEILVLNAKVRSDTVRLTKFKTDTLLVKKKGKWWNPLD